MISAIVAVDKDWGIGFEGQLLEHLPPDMKYFKETTMGNIVIMGRKTWDSLLVKPLQGRSNIILSRTLQRGSWIYDDKAHYIQFTPEITEHDLKAFQKSSNHLFVIGGGEIYKQLLPYCDRVYVTFIGKSHENVDTYFPNLDKDPNWKVSTCTELRDYGNIPYAFLTYDRIS
jgi:dihydrofolate reductase